MPLRTKRDGGQLVSITLAIVVGDSAAPPPPPTSPARPPTIAGSMYAPSATRTLRFPHVISPAQLRRAYPSSLPWPRPTYPKAPDTEFSRSPSSTALPKTRPSEYNARRAEQSRRPPTGRDPPGTDRSLMPGAEVFSGIRWTAPAARSAQYTPDSAGREPRQHGIDRFANRSGRMHDVVVGKRFLSPAVPHWTVRLGIEHINRQSSLAVARDGDL